MRMRSLPEISRPKTVNRGSVRRMTREMEKSRAMRMNMAMNRPTVLPLAC